MPDQPGFEDPNTFLKGLKQGVIPQGPQLPIKTAPMEPAIIPTEEPILSSGMEDVVNPFVEQPTSSTGDINNPFPTVAISSQAPLTQEQLTKYAPKPGEDELYQKWAKLPTGIFSDVEQLPPPTEEEVMAQSTKFYKDLAQTEQKKLKDRLQLEYNNLPFSVRQTYSELRTYNSPDADKFLGVALAKQRLNDTRLLIAKQHLGDILGLKSLDDLGLMNDFMQHQLDINNIHYTDEDEKDARAKLTALEDKINYLKAAPPITTAHEAKMLSGPDNKVQIIQKGYFDIDENDKDLQDAAKAILEKKEFYKQKYLDAIQRNAQKDMPFNGIPVLQTVGEGLVDINKFLNSFIKGATLDQIDISTAIGKEFNAEDIQKHQDISTGKLGQILSTAGEIAGSMMPYAGVEKGLAAIGMKYARPLISFPAVSTARQLLDNARNNKPIYNKLDDAAYNGFRDALVMSVVQPLARGASEGLIDNVLAQRTSEAILNGAGFMAITQPDIFKDPETALATLGVFAGMGFVGGRAEVRNERIKDYITDPAKLISDVRPENIKDIQEILDWSPTLANRLSTKETATSADLGKELDKVYEVLAAPFKHDNNGQLLHDTSDVLEAKTIYDEILNGTAIKFARTGNILSMYTDVFDKFDRLGSKAWTSIKDRLPQLELPLPMINLKTKIQSLTTTRMRGGEDIAALIRESRASSRYEAKQWQSFDSLYMRQYENIDTDKLLDQFKNLTDKQIEATNENSTLTLKVPIKNGDMRNITLPSWFVDILIKHIKPSEKIVQTEGAGITTADIQHGAVMGEPWAVSETITPTLSAGKQPASFQVSKPALVAADTLRLWLAKRIGQKLPTEVHEKNTYYKVNNPDEFWAAAKNDPILEMLASPDKDINEINGQLIQRSVQNRITAQMNRWYQPIEEMGGNDPWTLRPAREDINGNRTAYIIGVGDKTIEIPIDSLGAFTKRWFNDFYKRESGKITNLNPSVEFSEFNKLFDYKEGKLSVKPGKEFNINQNNIGAPIILSVPSVPDKYIKVGEVYVRKDIAADMQQHVAATNDIHKIWQRLINYWRFSKVAATFGGTVRDLIGDTYFNYFDLGPDGVRKVYKAMGLGDEIFNTKKLDLGPAGSFTFHLGAGARLKNLPTVPELFKLNRNIAPEQLIIDGNDLAEWGKEQLEADNKSVEELSIRLKTFLPKKDYNDTINTLNDIFSSSIYHSNLNLPRGVVGLRDWLLSDYMMRNGILNGTFQDVELEGFKSIFGYGKKAISGMMQFRSLPDNYTKGGAFLTWMDRIYNEPIRAKSENVETLRDISNRIARYYTVYDNVPDAFKHMGQNFGSVGANYFAEKIRIGYNVLREHPVRFALAAAFPRIMMELTSGLTDQEKNEWMKENGLFGIPIPGTKNVVDLSNAYPWADVLNDTVFRIDRPSTAFGEPEPKILRLLGHEPGVSKISPSSASEQFWSRAKPWLRPFLEDNPVYPFVLRQYGLDNFGNKIPASTSSAFAEIAPSIGVQAYKIIQALVDNTNKYGEKFDSVDQITKQLGVETDVVGQENWKYTLNILGRVQHEQDTLEEKEMNDAYDKRDTFDERKIKMDEIKKKYQSIHQRIKSRVEEVKKLIKGPAD